jgi:polyketide cyclase/dehydrase/lipid transport protein
MRRIRPVMAAAALILIGGPAAALEVSRHIETLGLPPAVWELAGGFCAIKDWHPLIADCQEIKEGDVTFRTLTLKDGGKIKEKLLESDDVSYSYEIVESPLPVKNYKAKFSVEDGKHENRTMIEWSAEFDANGASDEDATKKINEIFSAGLKGIKRKMLDLSGGESSGGGPSSE